jgi:hypothetical protein
MGADAACSDPSDKNYRLVKRLTFFAVGLAYRSITPMTVSLTAPIQENPMFTKSTIALAIIIGITSSAFAAPKQFGGNTGWAVYDSRGHYVGSDPDARVRHELQRDHGSTE